MQYRFNPQAQVVQTLDSTIHLLNNWGLVARKPEKTADIFATPPLDSPRNDAW